MTKTAQAIVEQQEAMPTQVPQVTNLLREALANPDVSVEKMRGIMDLQIRAIEQQAKMDFAVAMAKFQSLKEVVAYNREGTAPGNAKFGYADYPTMVAAVTPWMNQCDLSFDHHRDPPVVSDQGEVKLVMVHCVISHIGGHSKTFSGAAIPDERLKGKLSPSQLVQLAITYIKRQTLGEGLGVATGDDKQDDDAQVIEHITDKQAADIRAILDELGGPENEDKLLKWQKVDAVENLSAAAYPDVVAALERKR